MLDILEKTIERMPELVDVPLSEWEASRIDSLPTLDRLKRTVDIDGELFDLFLHKGTWPPKDIVPQPHTHACQSAMYIVHGKYKHTLGFGKETKSYEKVSTSIMHSGDSYEMVNPFTWHYFQPLTDFTLTIMIAGRPFHVKQPGVPGQLDVELPDEDAKWLLDAFQQKFCAEFFCA